MKRFLSFSLIAISFWVTPCISYAQSAKEAFMALKKLEARTQAGISYRDYGPALGEATFPVNLYLETAEGKESSDLANAIRRTMSIYSDARLSFRYNVKGGRFYGDNTNLGRYLLPKYPILGKRLSEGGARRPPSASKYDLYSKITTTILFDLAGQSLAEASKLLATSEKSARREQMIIDNLKAENARLTAENDRLSKENAQLRTDNDVLKTMLIKKKPR